MQLLNSNYCQYILQAGCYNRTSVTRLDEADTVKRNSRMVGILNITTPLNLKANQAEIPE